MGEGTEGVLEPTLYDHMDVVRQELKTIGAKIDQLKNEKGQSEQDGKENRGEVMANLTLAYRHIEDASMRLGKVKQHLNGGVSVYDKNVVGSPE